MIAELMARWCATPCSALFILFGKIDVFIECRESNRNAELECAGMTAPFSGVIGEASTEYARDYAQLCGFPLLFVNANRDFKPDRLTTANSRFQRLVFRVLKWNDDTIGKNLLRVLNTIKNIRKRSSYE